MLTITADKENPIHRGFRFVLAPWVLPALLLLTLPAAVRAQLTFTTNNGAITITGYTGSDADVVIPNTINGLPVTGIGTRAFFNLPALISVTIPSSSTNCQWQAFENCTNLLAAYFQGSAPKDYWPAAAPRFYHVPKATVYYLEGATGWGSMLGPLRTVQWNPGVLDNLICTTNNSTITITACVGASGPAVVPSTIKGLPVTCIEDSAFLNCGVLTGVTFPNTITTVGNLAFAGCTALTGVTIPISAIGSGAFSNCTALTDISFSTNVFRLADSMFSGCTALTTISIPSNVTNIGERAFQNCSNLSGVYFQGNEPTAPLSVFDGANNVTNYYFPKTAGWGTTFADRPTVPILFIYTTNGGEDARR